MSRSTIEKYRALDKRRQRIFRIIMRIIIGPYAIWYAISTLCVEILRAFPNTAREIALMLEEYREFRDATKESNR